MAEYVVNISGAGSVAGINSPSKTTTGINSTTATITGDFWPSYKPISPNIWNWDWAYPTTIYKYQITCPECKSNSNWCEIGKTTTCSCGAILKAVFSYFTPKKIHEVPVK